MQRVDLLRPTEFWGQYDHKWAVRLSWLWPKGKAPATHVSFSAILVGNDKRLFDVPIVLPDVLV